MDIPAKQVQILHDPDQGTAVVIQLFETADDMAAAEAALEAMDPSDTPGRVPQPTAARSRLSWAETPRGGRPLRTAKRCVALERRHL